MQGVFGKLIVRVSSANGTRNLCQTASVQKKLTVRTHVILPVVARDEVRRRQQLNALRAAKGAWKDEDHPELKRGVVAWVSEMRSESEKRFQKIEQTR
jgi:hypothetical protein